MKICVVIWILLMAALPFKEVCAASPFLYMMGHTGCLHYLMNGVGWLLCHPLVTGRRVMAAWSVSILAYVLLPNNPPVLGWSVVIYFFLGMCLTGRHRLMVLAPVAAGFFLPGIAAWHHAVMLIAGYIYRKVELVWRRTGY